MSEPVAQLSKLKSYQKIFRIFLPIAFSLIANQSMELLDVLMIGRYSAISLAAAGFSTSLVIVAQVVGFGILSSVTTLAARSFGRKNQEELSLIAENGVKLSLFVSVALLIFCEFLRSTLEIFLQPPEVNGLARDYLFWVNLSLVPMFIFQGLRHFSEGLGRTVFPSVAVLLSLALNACLNYLLIYGKMGFPELGLTGAALGTFYSRIFLLLGFVVYLIFSRDFSHYPLLPFRWKKLFSIEKQTLNQLVKVGLPTGSQYFFEVGFFASTSIACGWLGTQILAAHHIALKVATFTFMVPSAMGQASNIVVSHYTGAENWQESKRQSARCFEMIVLMMILITVPMLFIPDQMVGIFTDNQAIVNISAGLVFIAGCFQIVDGIQAVALGVLKAYLDVLRPVLIALFSYWTIAVPLGYYLTFVREIGPSGIWYAMLVSLSIAALLLMIRLRKILDLPQYRRHRA